MREWWGFVEEEDAEEEVGSEDQVGGGERTGEGGVRGSWVNHNNTQYGEYWYFGCNIKLKGVGCTGTLRVLLAVTQLPAGNGNTQIQEINYVPALGCAALLIHAQTNYFV